MKLRRNATASIRCRARSGGIVLLAVLIALALGGLAAMAAADVWALTRQRAMEQELLFVGEQYRLAIYRYFVGAPPGTPRVLPSSLDDLLDDDRFPMPVHHLRRKYPDPITGNTDWGLARSGDRIVGVFSQSDKEPLKQAGFAVNEQSFTGTTSYHDWVFAPVIKGHPITNPSATATPASGPSPSLPSTPTFRTPS